MKTRIEECWNSLKGLKAAEIEEEIEFSRSAADEIINVAEIDKVRNSSLLKFLIFELIVFAD